MGLLRRVAFSGLALKGARLVRLIYLDESGVSELVQEPHVVVAGVVLDPDRHYRAIDEDLLQAVIKYVPPDRMTFFKSFHATELFNGTGKVFTRPEWPIERTLPIIRRIIKNVLRHRLPIVYGVADKSRYLPGRRDHTFKSEVQGAHDMAFLQALLRANRWMRLHAAPDELAMVICEDNEQMRAGMRRTQAWLRAPTFDIPPELMADIPLDRIIESVLFMQKEESQVLCLADMCAYILKRRVANKRLDGLFEWIAPLLDRNTSIENDPIAAAALAVPIYHYRWGYAPWA